MRKIVYTTGDGRVAVVTPVLNRGFEDITEAEAEARAFALLPSDAIDPHYVEAAAIPADRSFRDAWRHAGEGRVVIDMPAARQIHRDALRALRAPKLAWLDRAYMRADEAGNAKLKADIARLKQALRDVPADPAIEAAKTPEDLRDVMPAALVDPALTAGNLGQ
jgi:hypothetical protein